MALVTNTPTNPDPKTGTRRVNLWRESAAGGQWGDNARGYGYSARYVSDDGYGCAEISVYPVEYEDGTFGVDEMATIGRAVTEDGIVRPDDSADISYEGGSALAFATLEDAQREADRLGQEDQSFATYLRKR
jgi:hypothetical protein